MDILEGQRFERLIVIERSDDYVSKSGGKHARYKCKCDCGEYIFALKEHLTSGRTKSCGCLRSDKAKGNYKHGKIHSRLYKIWSNMLSRCDNPNVPAYSRYGAVGIKVCDDWHDFINFMNWSIDNGYTDDLTIDRIDNELGYNPDNCRWASVKEQANNKRDNVYLEYMGERKTIAEWADSLNVKYKALYQRLLRCGYDMNKALEKPFRKSPAVKPT